MSALFILVAFSPAVAADEGATSEGEAPEITVSTEDAERFAEIWTARFRTDGVLDAYFEHDRLFDDGYNDLSRHDKAYLVQYLVDHWMRTIPEFRDGMQDPEDGQTPSDRLEQVKVFTYATIFEKEQMKQMLGAPDTTKPDPQPAPEASDGGVAARVAALHDKYREGPALPDVPRLPEDTGVVGGTPRTEPFAPLPGGDLVRGRENARSFTPAEPEALPDMPDATLVVPERVRGLEDDVWRAPVTIPDYVAPDPDAGVPLDVPERVGDVTNVWRPPVDAPERPPVVPDTDVTVDPPVVPDPLDDPDLQLPGDTLPGLEDVLDTVRRLVPPLDVRTEPPGVDDVLHYVDAGTYTACGALADGDLVCSPVPVPLGVPTPLDLDMDPLTGTGGAEVLVHLTPAVRLESFPASASASVSVKRTDALSTESLPAKAFVVYNVPEADLQVQAGFDGTASTLSAAQEAVFTVKDVAQAFLGDVQTRLEVTHDTPGESAALLAGVAQIGRSTTPATVKNPVAGSFSFTPVPEEFQFDFNVSFADEENTELGVHVLASERTKLEPEVTIEESSTGAVTVLGGAVDELPRDLSMDVLVHGDEVDAAYAASADIAEVSLGVDAFPNGVNAPDVTRIRASVQDVPLRMSMHYAPPFDVTYDASGAITQVAALVETRDDAGVKERLSARIEGIPSRIALTGTDAPLHVTYTADRTVDLIEVAMESREEQLEAAARVEGIPRTLEVSADDASLAFEAGSPIGLVEATYRKGAADAAPFQGNHAHFVNGQGAAQAASVRVTGFTSLRVAEPAADEVRVDVEIAGGNPFRFRAEDVDRDLLAFGEISNVPTAFTVHAKPQAVEYDAADVIASVSTHAEIGALTADVAITDLPSTLAIAWSDGAFSYAADAEITRVTASVTMADADTTLTARVDGLPENVDVTFDDQHYNATASAPVDLVAVTASVGGVTPRVFQGEHVSYTGEGADRFAASALITGFTSVDADLTTADVVDASLRVAGGEPFRFAFDDAVSAITVDGTISNLPDAIDVHLTDDAFTYDASARINHLGVTAVMPDLAGDVHVYGIPDALSVAWSDTALAYDATAGIDRVTAHVEKPSQDLVADADVRGIPSTLDVSYGSDVLGATASAPIDLVAATVSVGGLEPVALPGEHASYVDEDDAYAASVRLTGFESATLDMRTADVVDATVRVTGGEPFTFLADSESANAFANGSVSNLPESLHVTFTPDAATYAASAVIDRVFAQAAVGDVTGEVDVRGIPGELSVAWTDSTLAYRADAAITRVSANVHVPGSPNLTINANVEGIPTALDVVFDDQHYAATASGPVDLLEAAVSGGDVTPEVLTGDHVTFKGVATDRFAASARVTGFEAFDADLRTPDVVDASVRAGNGNAFRVLLDDAARETRVEGSISNLPSAIDVRLTDDAFTYASNARIGHVGVDTRMPDLVGNVHVYGIPADLSVSWSDTTLSYDASAGIDRVVAHVEKASQDLVADATVVGLPSTLDVSYGGDRLGATAGSAIDLIEATLSAGGLVATTFAGDHATYVDRGSARAAGLSVTGFTSVDVDLRTADVVDATLRVVGNDPFEFLAVSEGMNALANGTISNIPGEIRVTVEPNAAAYHASAAIGRVFAHAEVGNLTTDAWVLGIPADVTLSWSGDGLTYDASAPITEIGARVHNAATPDVVVNARVKDVPDDFAIGWPTGGASFSSTDAIGRVEVGLSVNGGSAHVPATDHATVRKQGDVVGASLRVTGLQALSVDASNGLDASLALSPGGQAFWAVGQVENLTAYATVSNLPTAVSLSLTPDANSFGYTSDRTIDSLRVAAWDSSDGMNAYLSMNDLPATLDLAWTLGTTPVITYTASGSLRSIYASYRESTNGARYIVSVSGLAPFVQVRAEAARLTVDTRTSATGAAGSGSIASISAAYASDGALSRLSGDHAYYYDKDDATRFSFRYDGLRYARAGFSGSDIDIDVRNTDARKFTARAEVGTLYGNVVVDKVPPHLTITSDGNVFTYDAHGTTIDRISAFVETSASRNASIEILGIPDEITLNLDLPNNRVWYDATRAVDAVNVDAFLDAWEASLRVSGIPRNWTLDMNHGFELDVPDGAIDLVDATLTNHGTVTRFDGNHLAANYTQGFEGEEVCFTTCFRVSIPDTVDASFRMTSVEHASYTKTGDQNNVRLEMGGGEDFRVWGKADFVSGTVAHADVSLSPLPTDVTVSIGETTLITTDRNFDLSAYVEVGDQAAIDDVPTPYTFHGVTLRDGADGDATALKARMYLTGMPTTFFFDGSRNQFSFQNWRPTSSYVFVDVDLDDVVSKDIDVFSYFTDLSTTRATSLSFRTSANDASGTKKVTWDVNTNRPLGRFYAYGSYGDHYGRVYISNIPSSVQGSFRNADGVTTITWNANDPIDMLSAGYKRTGDTSIRAYTRLTDIPSDFTLTLGRDGGGKGPLVQYDASASTLDLLLEVQASLFGGDVKARLDFSITNLGKDVDTHASSSAFRIVSTPATDRIIANVWASYDSYSDDSGREHPLPGVTVDWSYHMGWGATIKNLVVDLKGASNFRFQWGLVSKASGSFTSFEVKWDSLSIRAHVGADVDATVDLPGLDPFTVNLVDAHRHPSLTIDVVLHKFKRGYGFYEDWNGWAVCEWWVDSYLKPDHRGSQQNRAYLGSGGTWYITPDPEGLIPDWLVEWGTSFMNPDGGGLKLELYTDCWPHITDGYVKPSNPDETLYITW